MDRVRLCLLQLTLSLIVVVAAQDDYCADFKYLEDYGPRLSRKEEREVCRTELEKTCTNKTVKQCLLVTDLRCELELFPDCSMAWTKVEAEHYWTEVKEKPLYECEKILVPETHSKVRYSWFQ